MRLVARKCQGDRIGSPFESVACRVLKLPKLGHISLGQRLDRFSDMLFILFRQRETWSLTNAVATLTAMTRGSHTLGCCSLPYTRRKRLDCISRSHALKRAVAALSYAPKEESHFGSYVFRSFSISLIIASNSQCTFIACCFCFLSVFATLFGLLSRTPSFSPAS